MMNVDAMIRKYDSTSDDSAEHDHVHCEHWKVVSLDNDLPFSLYLSPLFLFELLQLPKFDLSLLDGLNQFPIK